MTVTAEQTPSEFWKEFGDIMRRTIFAEDGGTPKPQTEAEYEAGLAARAKRAEERKQRIAERA